MCHLINVVISDAAESDSFGKKGGTPTQKWLYPKGNLRASKADGQIVMECSTVESSEKAESRASL